MTGADILIQSLKAQNVRCIVGMPGNQNIDIYDALLRIGGIDHYLIRNEQGATLIANGFARASGEVGVALTVPGPGNQRFHRHRRRPHGLRSRAADHRRHRGGL